MATISKQLFKVHNKRINIHAHRYRNAYSLGIDIGTSGIRGVIMNSNQQIQAQAAVSLPAGNNKHSDSTKFDVHAQTAELWWTNLQRLLKQLGKLFDLQQISHLALDGTSGTVLLADEIGTPLTPALMYNDQRAVKEAQLIDAFAPDNTAAIGPASGLAKVMWLCREHAASGNNTSYRYILNQADWLLGKLSGQFGLSDPNNCAKLGYDASKHCWPDWLSELDFPVQYLPRVLPPGHVVANISATAAQDFGFNPALKLCAGTTDSTAAIIASGAALPGEAVTSLGSTLVMKVISEKPVFNQHYGVYSQPLHDYWLVGGASNSGGAVLKSFFSIAQMEQMSSQIMDEMETGRFSYLDLDYYPLLIAGERFPILDPRLCPKLQPRADNDTHFFQALLEGMAAIEAAAYQRLLELGAPYPKIIRSMGGGAHNSVWSKMRQGKCGVPVTAAAFDEAAAGTAILAQTEWH